MAAILCQSAPVQRPGWGFSGKVCHPYCLLLFVLVALLSGSGSLCWKWSVRWEKVNGEDWLGPMLLSSLMHKVSSSWALCIWNWYSQWLQGAPTGKNADCWVKIFLPNKFDCGFVYSLCNCLILILATSNSLQFRHRPKYPHLNTKW